MNIVIVATILLGVSLFIIKSYPALMSPDEILFSFSVTSDSQADLGDPDTSVQDRKWTVNSKVLSRMIGEIQEQKPKILFFCGDAIDGYTHGDMNELNNEYAFWRGNMAKLFETGTYVFPVPGNHDMQDTDMLTGMDGATVLNEEAWRNNLGDIIPNKKLWESILGEAFSNSSWSDINYAQYDGDGITTDQSKLSYSFDYKGSHFIIINTYAVGNDSHVPITRLKEDIFDAKRRAVKHIFIFGHEPAFSYKYDAASGPRGLDIDPKARDEFWKLVEDNKATYFCGHEHLFNAGQFGNGKAYQIIVGPAGGGFKAVEPVRNPDLLKYTWVTVKVHKNGTVHLDAYGFGKNQSKTRVLKCWELEKGF
jgi:hypothetical protein